MFNALYQRGYFISIGGQGKMFTLRQGNNIGEEWHIQNLGHDMQTAEKRAKEITGFDLEAPSMILNPLASKVTWDEAKLPYGKHKGRFLSEVVNDDLGYLVWWSNRAKEFYESCPNERVKRFDKLVMETPEVIAEIEKRDAAYAVRKAQWEAEAQALRESSVHLGEVGERIQFTGTITFEKSFENEWGYSYLTKIRTDEGSEVIYWNLIPCLVNDVRECAAKPTTKMDATKGDRVTFFAKVKKHDEYNGVKQTVVQRATKGKLLGASEETARQLEVFGYELIAD
jgi:hypothetical protein